MERCGGGRNEKKTMQLFVSITTNLLKALNYNVSPTLKEFSFYWPKKPFNPKAIAF